MPHPPALPAVCRRFRADHAEFVDGRLRPAVALARTAHRDTCPACAAHDARVRRALMTLVLLDPPRGSPGFVPQLAARLTAARGGTPLVLRR